LVKVGEDISEQLDVELAKFFVHRHIRSQQACRNCETITAAPFPPAIIDCGIAALGLLAWMLISKYPDHLINAWFMPTRFIISLLSTRKPIMYFSLMRQGNQSLAWSSSHGMSGHEPQQNCNPLFSRK
jgi:hypothetical protein